MSQQTNDTKEIKQDNTKNKRPSTPRPKPPARPHSNKPRENSNSTNNTKPVTPANSAEEKPTQTAPASIATKAETPTATQSRNPSSGAPRRRPAAPKPSTAAGAASAPKQSPATRAASAPKPSPATGSASAPKPSPATGSASAPKPSPATGAVTSAESKPVRAPRPAAAAPRVSGRKSPLRIIPLGGLGEIGKNITYYEYQNEALLVDCGMAFPDEGMLGVDIVIPDFEYVLKNRQKIRGLYITHGHEDHIGAIPYLLKDFNVPIYATRLAASLIENKLKEHGLLKQAKINTVKAGSIIKQGSMQVEFINVNHSIPDSCALAIHSPVGIVIQTGDFKVDYTPISGDVINLARFGELGSQGVLALLSDSTNAERPGSNPSERMVGDSFDKLFAAAPDKRIVIASFASNVYRVQQMVNAAIKHGRKVAVTGRSMENVVARSLELGYLEAPNNIIITLAEADKLPPEQVVLVTTGSQGEPMAALTRMARGEHRMITLTAFDRVIISASPIPGNENAVSHVVDDLLRKGVDVIYERTYDIHVSGHACQEELKLLIALVKPKFFFPVHGEFRQLKKHFDLAQAMGIPVDRIHISENGQVIDLYDNHIRQTETVTAGEVLVDGLGVGDVGSVVLRDRKHLSEDGLIVIVTTIERKTGKILAGPDIISRGFVYMREAGDLINNTASIARKSIEKSVLNKERDWTTMKSNLRDDISSYLWQQTKRNPMILPMIQEI